MNACSGVASVLDAVREVCADGSAFIKLESEPVDANIASSVHPVDDSDECVQVLECTCQESRETGRTQKYLNSRKTRSVKFHTIF